MQAAAGNRPGGRSVRAASADDGAQGPGHDPRIEREAASPHVLRLDGEALLERAIGASVDLPQPGDAGPNTEELDCLRPATELVGEVRPGPDDAHLATQNVP